MKKIWIAALLAVWLVACGSEKSLFQQAKEAAARGNYPKALNLYGQLIKQNPQHAAALTNRALIWEKMPAKDADELAKNRAFAQEDYLRALAINPDQAETYNNLGALYMDMDRNADAAGLFTQALLRQPTYFTALVNRATAYSKLGDMTQALMDFEAAAQVRPHDPALLLNRGLAYMDMGKYEAAVDDFSHALVSQPANARLYLERARALAKLGYPGEAYNDLAEAISLKPSYALAYYYLGELMFKNGDSDYALGALVKSKELAPKYVPTYDLMGDMLALQDPVAATANYLVCIKLDPSNALKYQRKIERMKTEEGRYRVLTERFYPQGRSYDSNARRIDMRPVATGGRVAQTVPSSAPASVRRGR